MNKVLFHNADKRLNIPNRKGIKAAILALIEQEGRVLERLDYVFCSDTYLLNINIEFLKHHYYTDIITFDLSNSGVVKGEIYVSLDRVKDNGANHKTAFQNELARVIFHGALHLCGYRDKKKSEITIMRSKEDHYLLLFEKKINGGN